MLIVPAPRSTAAILAATFAEKLPHDMTIAMPPNRGSRCRSDARQSLPSSLRWRDRTEWQASADREVGEPRAQRGYWGRPLTAG